MRNLGDRIIYSDKEIKSDNNHLFKKPRKQSINKTNHKNQKLNQRSS